MIGRGLHAAAFRVGERPDHRLLHVPSLRLRAAGRSETLEIADYAGMPLLLQAVAGEERVVLIGVSLPEGASLPADAAGPAAAQAPATGAGDAH